MMPTPVEEVRSLMSVGEYREAQSRLQKMISAKKSNPTSELLILNAECSLGIGLPKEAVRDCAAVLKDKASPAKDQRSALIIRALAHLQMGDFESAERDATSANDKKTLTKIRNARIIARPIEGQFNNGQLDEARKGLNHLLPICPKAPKYLKMRSEIAWMELDFDEFAHLTKDLIDEFPNDSKLSYRRGVVMLCGDNLDEAKKSFDKSSKAKKPHGNSTLATRVVSAIIQDRNNFEKAVKAKNLSLAEQIFNELVEETTKFCHESSRLVKMNGLLEVKLIKLRGDKKYLLELLDTELQKNPENEELLLERGQLHLENGDFEAALFDFNVALRLNPGSVRARQGLNEATEQKKQATHVDLYAIFELERSATREEIQNQYKLLARKWHPDRFSNPNDKRNAELMMKKINSAYEILIDPKKRKRYDAGRDPDDESDQGHFPFGGFPFGGFGGEEVEVEDISGQEGGGANPFDFINDIFKAFEGGVPFGEEIHIQF
jgi:tetratricopeptide (TPR) repeat protein